MSLVLIEQTPLRMKRDVLTFMSMDKVQISMVRFVQVRFLFCSTYIADPTFTLMPQKAIFNVRSEPTRLNTPATSPSTNLHRLRTLPSLLSTDHSNDPTQLGTLRRMLLDHLLLHALRLRQIRRRLQHPVLQLQHHLQRIVQEGSRECYVRGSAAAGACAGKTHLEFARATLVVGVVLGRWFLRFRPVGWRRMLVRVSTGCRIEFLFINAVEFITTYFSTNVILSAISATLFAILEAMIAYADPTPLVGISPATDAALFITGAAFCWGCGRETGPLGTCRFGALGRLAGWARGAFDGLPRGMAPLTVDRCCCAWVAMLSTSDVFVFSRRGVGMGFCVILLCLTTRVLAKFRVSRREILGGMQRPFHRLSPTERISKQE